MQDQQLLVDLVLAVVAAFIGGTLAHRMGQPVILGYLLAGVAIGPFTLGTPASAGSVQVLAEIGVALLMFALGAEASVGELRRIGRVAIIGGALQILCTMGLGPLLAPQLGLTFAQGMFLGALLALSSTVVALKVLMDRGELGALHGRVALGILIAQDLAVVPMVVALPAIAAGGEHLLMELIVAALKAGGVLLGAYFIGIRLVPFVLGRAAITRTRELFLLGVVALALGTAVVTQLAGLSLAFGAFLAGVVVAESEYRRQVVAEVLPLRDLFASLFFVSVGMLIDPRTLLAEAGVVAGLSLIVITAKVVIAAGVVLLLGMPGRVALLVGLAVAQIGEFSFVLARVGVDNGAIPASLFDLILATALVTIVVTPSLIRAAPILLSIVLRIPGVEAVFRGPADSSEPVEGLAHHAVICGYGRVGRELAHALAARGIPYLVIEYHPEVAQDLRDQGVPVVYGDAANPAVLEHAHLDRARLLAILMPDANAAELATRHAKAMNHRLDIVARGAGVAELDRLRKAGASEVVQPEFEAGQEVIRHSLRRFGLGGLELSNLITGRRAAYYRRMAEEEPA
jgi:monovalent cation:H+ antiporter-2, CPA2 family